MNATIKTNCSDPRDFKATTVSSGMIDNKRRAIGFCVSLAEFEFVNTPDAKPWWTQPAGEYYGARVQTARDGVEYGAYQGWEYFKTLSERESYVETRIRNATKTYARKFANYNRAAA